jgi:hypothetical protein
VWSCHLVVQAPYHLPERSRLPEAWVAEFISLTVPCSRPTPSGFSLPRLHTNFLSRAILFSLFLLAHGPHLRLICFSYPRDDSCNNLPLDGSDEAVRRGGACMPSSTLL